MRLRATIPMLLALLAVLAPSTASGSIAEVSSGNRLLYLAGSGETNDLTISQAGTTWTFRDPGATITAGAGCVAVTPNEAACTVTGPLAAIRADLGDLDDRAVGDGSVREPADGFEPFNLNGGPGNDRLVAPPEVESALRGADLYFDNPGDDELVGGNRDDVLYGGAGADQLDGGGGRDELFGGTGDDLVRGGDGRDLIASEERGPDGADRLIGGRDHDRLDYDRGQSVSVTVNGQADDGYGCPGPGCEGDDVGPDIESVETGAGDDVIAMGAIANYVSSGAGDDVVDGGGGDDDLSGGEGDDRLSGGAGDDFFYDSDGSDRVAGDAGDDVFEHDVYSPEGSDTFTGGAGDDLASYVNSYEAVRVSLDGRADDGPPGKGDNIGRDVEDVIGTDGADVLIGSKAANELTGLGGADRLVGGKGADALLGGSGRDQLVPGAGADALDGGSGNDLLKARGGGRDDLLCGAGKDRFSGDRGDRVGRDCDRRLKPKKKRRRR